jgi:hypothetical protein
MKTMLGYGTILLPLNMKIGLILIKEMKTGIEKQRIYIQTVYGTVVKKEITEGLLLNFPLLFQILTL